MSGHGSFHANNARSSQTSLFATARSGNATQSPIAV